jgi:adenylate kinase
MFNLVIFGPPGAGKGTQSEGLLDRYGLTHLSTGDVFRANIKGETKLGVLAKSYMDKGELVPDEVTIAMVEDFVQDRDGDKGFVFDGFPRTIQQGQALDAFLAGRNQPINIVLALEVQEEELVRRLLERGKLSGRADDQSEATIRNRFKEYQEKTEPLLDYYEKQGKLHRVAGMGSIDTIFGNLCNAVDSVRKEA